MFPHPQSRELPQGPHLRKSDRLERMAETEPAAALHLTKDQCQPSISNFRGDNVDLPQPTAPIPLQHPHPMPRQLSTSQVSPACANMLLGLRLRHRPPPNGSMR